MAKKRASAAPRSGGAVERVTIISLKGSPELRDWLAAVSEKTLIPAASIVRAGLAEWAAKNGHPAPPKR